MLNVEYLIQTEFEKNLDEKLLFSGLITTPVVYNWPAYILLCEGCNMDECLTDQYQYQYG